MSIDKKMIPEPKLITWKPEGDNAVIRHADKMFLLNASMRIVWEKINGINTVEDITNQILKEFSDDNDDEHIWDVIETALDSLLKNDLITLKEDYESDGWVQYE